MTKQLLYIISLFLLFFTSCDEEKLTETYSDSIQIATYIQSSSPSTRAHVGTDGKGYFTENDKISLLIQATKGNMVQPLTLIAGSWTPSLSWQDLGEMGTFSAFYPQTEEFYRDEFTHVVELDQSEGNNFEKSDLLYASTTTVKQGNPVNLEFKHLLSSLTIKLKGDAYTEEEIKDASLIVKAFHKIQIKKSGEIGELHDYNSQAHKENNASEIKLKYQGESTFQAILCPQKVNNLSWGNDWLKIRIGGKEYQLKVPEKLADGRTFEGFEAGKNTTFTLTISEEDTAFSSQTRWVYGITGIPDVASWKYHDAILKFKGLPWNSSYGWFDCNKVSTVNPGDMNMCWAATSANLVHWWLEQNQVYLDKFNYNGPRAYNNHLESEVFQAYKDNFVDEGYFPLNGINWFIHGGPVDENKLKNQHSGGYFKQVFSHSLVEAVHISDYQSLNNTIKRALDNNQAIGISILMKGFGGSGHALTIWGADFDKQGNVRSIYYVENNDRSTAEQLETEYEVPAGLLIAKVGEKDGKAVMENSQHQLEIPIRSLTLLSLGQDQWETYFKNLASTEQN